MYSYKMASPTDNYQLNFVNKVPEEFNCSICTKRLDEPMLTDCCGQHFCKACLENWFETSLAQKRNKSCPHCRNENFSYIIDRPVKRKIDDLKIYCPNHRQGCARTFPFRDLREHMTTCGYVTVECTNKCGEVLLRKNLQEHCQQSCLRRMVKCERCGVTSTFIEITTSHLNTSKCPDVHFESTGHRDETVLHFSWESTSSLRTPSFYLSPGYKVHIRCEMTAQENIEQRARLLTKTADGVFSLVLERGERDDTLTWPIPNEIEMRLEQFQALEETEHSYKGTPIRLYQILCSECDPSIDLSRVGIGSKERVICMEKTFGHPNFTDEIRNGFHVHITLTKHSCNHGDDEDDNGSN